MSFGKTDPGTVSNALDNSHQRILRAKSTGLRKYRQAIGGATDDDACRNPFQQAARDANARRTQTVQRRSSAIAANQTDDVPTFALDQRGKFASQLRRHNRAVPAIAGRQHDDDI